jgi:hypothetical protein
LARLATSGSIQQNDFVRSKLFLRLVLVLAIATALFLTTAFIWRKPVLFHILAETGCACGDFHEEVTGLALFNPFRNRSPERSAQKFLEGLRDGSCSADEPLCRYAMDGHRVSQWRLSNLREEDGNLAALYYKLTKLGVEESKFRLTGEGMVELARTRDGWTVVNYSSYF